MIRVGLDIGNSKISCVVSDLKTNHRPRILSFVSHPTSNLNKGSFINFQQTIKEVREVLDISEKQSQTEIKSVNLGIPLSTSESFFYNSQISIDNEVINDLHLKKALNNSDFFDEHLNKKILMNYIVSYEIDGKLTFESPIGNYANTLILNFYKLLLDKNLLNTYENLFNEINIHVANFIPKSLSSSLATLNLDDKDLGSICIDLGESSTSISIFENNVLIFCDSIAIGSKNITNDIARGISTTKDSAERLKTLYGSVITSPSDEFEIIEVPTASSNENEFKQINRSTINAIIKPRVEETLELIWQKLKQYGLHKKRIKNLILTGGGSQLEGIEDYAQAIFDSNVRLGKSFGFDDLNKNFSGPEFSQTLGLVLYDESKYQVNFIQKIKNPNKINLFGRFSSWLDKYI